MRFTKQIKDANNYCKYDLKYSPYKEIFDLTSNIHIEDYVNTDLTLAIDKLGELEDAFEIIEKMHDKKYLVCYNSAHNIVSESFNDYTITYDHLTNCIVAFRLIYGLYGERVKIVNFEMSKYKIHWWLEKSTPERKLTMKEFM